MNDPNKKKMKVMLSPEVRAQFDKVLDDEDREKFDVWSGAIAAIAEDPCGVGRPVWTAPTPEALKAVRGLRGICVLHRLGGIPASLLDPAASDDAVDWSSMIGFELTVPRKQGLELVGLRNLAACGFPMGLTEDSYQERVIDLVCPRRWWLAGLRQPWRTLRSITWSDDAGCWEARMGPRKQPLLFQFAGLTVDVPVRKAKRKTTRQ